MTFKIIYAAGNNDNAKIQLQRFLAAVADQSNYQIKIAAFKRSTPKNIAVDWTLDCFINIHNTKEKSVYLDSNNNYAAFFEQIKSFNPNLIISDLEYFTSSIAINLNLTLWQCSPYLYHYSRKCNKVEIPLFTRYGYLFDKGGKSSHIKHIIDNSNQLFIYSHLGDAHNWEMDANFQWIRPYHSIGKKYVPCQHNIVAGMASTNNKKILTLLKKQVDPVIFAEFTHETYHNIWLKDFTNQEEYFCNLANCNLFVSEGQTSFMADAYYNGKYTIIPINFQDVDCVQNGILSEYLGIGQPLYNLNKKLTNKTVIANYKPDIKFLHRKIEELT